MTDGLDEVSATAAIMFSALPEDFVGSTGEAVEIQVPELVLIDSDFEQRIGILYHLCEVSLEHRLEFRKIHIVCTSLFYFFFILERMKS
jgi:hypothetical protein